jgi:hypothetical protein
MIDLWTDRNHVIHASDNGYTTLCDKPLPDMDIAATLEPTCQHCLYVLDLRQARAEIAADIAKARSEKQYPFDPVESHFPNFGEAIPRHINDRIRPFPELLPIDSLATLPNPLPEAGEGNGLEQLVDLARKIDYAQKVRHSLKPVRIQKTLQNSRQMEKEMDQLMKVVRADLFAGEAVTIQVSGFSYELRLENSPLHPKGEKAEVSHA